MFRTDITPKRSVGCLWLCNKPRAYICQKGSIAWFTFAELIFGRACYHRQFSVSRWFGPDNKKTALETLIKDNSLKQLKTANPNRPWAYIPEGLLSEGCFANEIWGAYFRGGRGVLIIGILRYVERCVDV